jgi:hypothetical protein
MQLVIPQRIPYTEAIYDWKTDFSYCIAVLSSKHTIYEKYYSISSIYFRKDTDVSKYFV